MIATPATLADLAALYDGLGIVTPRESEWHTISAQLALGPAWAFRADAKAPPNALAGIIVGLESVVWFRSGAGAERVMPGLVRAFRGLLAAVARSAPGPIVTWEQPDNPTGHRIARALGFRDTGRRMNGRIEIWGFEYGNGNRCSSQRGVNVLRQPVSGEQSEEAAEKP